MSTRSSPKRRNTSQRETPQRSPASRTTESQEKASETSKSTSSISSQLTGQRIVSTVTTTERVSSVGTGKPSVTAPLSSSSSGSSVKTPVSGRVGHGRSPSPVRISRTEEKEEIAHLNTRLATYIDYVRSKETAAEKISHKLTSFSECHEAELASIKEVYEREISGLRKALDLAAGERSKLQVDNKKLAAEHAEMSGLLAQRNKDSISLEKRIETLEVELAAVRADAKHYGILRGDHDKLVKQHEMLKKQLEKETLLRTEVENRLQTMSEKLALKEKIFAEEKSKLQQRKTLFEEEITVAKQAEFESRLAKELALARAESDEAMAQFRIDMETTFKSKLTDLRKISEKHSAEAVNSREEIIAVRKRIDAMSRDLAQAQSEVTTLRKRNEQLEASLEQQRADYGAQIAHYKEEIQSLHLDLQAKFEEYNELMVIKVQLDQEIMAYRKLLELEESRLNLSPSRTTSPFSGDGRKLKRRRMAADGSFEEEMLGHTHSSSAYTIQKEQCGAVQFDEADIQGQFVRLHNSGGEAVNLSGWTVCQSADNMPQVVYKFTRQAQLKAGGSCTLWSANSGAKHEPPGAFLMKDKTFSTGKVMRITLHDDKNQEVASCSLTLDYSKVEGGVRKHKTAGDGEKCLVM